MTSDLPTGAETCNPFEGVINVESWPLNQDDVTEALSNIGLKNHRDPWTNEIIQGPPLRASEMIARCARESRFDLIENAAKILRGDHKLLAMVYARKAASILGDYAISLADGRHGKDMGLATDPSKSDVLMVLQEWQPELRAKIPKNRGQLAAWWKRAELDHLPQTRGNGSIVPEPVMKALRQIKNLTREGSGCS